MAPFTRAEIGVLLAACPPTPVGRRDRAIILVLLDTGIRCSELAQLRLGDFDATTQRIHVRHGKANKQRVVAFAERCAAAVELYFEERGRLPGAPLRRSERRQRPLDGISDRTQTERHQADAAPTGPAGRRPNKVHAHRFRHTFATWAIEHDARELDVQYLLGHASPDMVRRYSSTYRSAQAAHRHAQFSPADQML